MKRKNTTEKIKNNNFRAIYLNRKTYQPVLLSVNTASLHFLFAINMKLLLTYFTVKKHHSFCNLSGIKKNFPFGDASRRYTDTITKEM